MPYGVTILTGFLGSGKTTLLNRILKQYTRIAIIENEFGDQTGIEKLVARNGAEDSIDLDELFIELGNGCICCSVKDSLATTLEGLVKKKGDKFDHIIIETSGLADPGPLAATLWLDEELESELFLNGIVTLVDLVNIDRYLLDEDEGSKSLAYRQIAYADKILLNKSDLLQSESEYASIYERMKAINPLASVNRTDHANLGNLNEIFNLRSFKLEGVQTAWKRLSLYKNDSHDHDPRITTVTLQEKRPVDSAKFKYELGKLLWEGDAGVEIYRIKGVVNCAGSEKVCYVQGVHDTFEVEESDQQWESFDAPRETKIVFIAVAPYVVREVRASICRFPTFHTNAAMSRKGEVSYINVAWVVGFAVYLFGQILNFLSLSLIDQPTQSIISSLALFSNCIFARRYFDERIRLRDIVALCMIILSIILFVLFYVHEDQDIAMNELEAQFKSFPFVVTAFAFFGVFASAQLFVKCHPKKVDEKANLTGIAYAVVAAIVGGVTVTFSKIIALIIRGFATGKLGAGTSWFLLLVVVFWVFLLVYSVHALNIGLSNSPAMVMIPTFYVLSNIVAIWLGIVFYKEYETFESPVATLMCFISVCLSMSGVYILAIREASESVAKHEKIPVSEDEDVEREPMIDNENGDVELQKA